MKNVVHGGINAMLRTQKSLQKFTAYLDLSSHSIMERDLPQLDNISALSGIGSSRQKPLSDEFFKSAEMVSQDLHEKSN